MLNSIFYSIKQAFVQAFRNRAMSLASVFSITAMLLILGLFFVLIVNIGVAIESAKQDYDVVSAYMYDEIDYEDTKTIMQDIKQMDEVLSVSYLDKETALAQWKAEEWGSNAHLLDSLVENPLPNSIEVQVAELSDADAVVDKLGEYTQIEQINYYKDTVEKLIKVTNTMQIAMLVIMGFLVIISVVVVSNTIKLTVFARQREIEIMKYIGATNWFIRGPFLAEGILIGLVSAIISAGLSALLYSRIVAWASQQILLVLGVGMVPVGFLAVNIFIIFLALGVSIGACGSIVSMRRFLDT